MEKSWLPKTIGLFAFCVMCFAIGAVHTDTSDTEDFTREESYKTFKNFIDVYNKTYASTAELHARYEIFKQSLERHRTLNAARIHPQDAQYGVTQFSDLTPEEFANTALGHRSLIKGYKPTPVKQLVEFPKTWKDVAPKFDWRDKKVISKPRDQGSCGGCWAFSIVECIETMYALKTGKLVEMSPQYLIDCANTTADHGCSGGNLCATLSWLRANNQSLVTEKEYPYKAKTEKCKKTKTTSVRAADYTCQGYHDNEDLMVSLLYNHGPLAVAVDATSWQDYLGGIIQHHCYDRFDNHAVQIVGYDKSGPVPYYIVRNSWGPKWGLNGYLNIKIGENLCGIANTVASVDVQ